MKFFSFRALFLCLSALVCAQSANGVWSNTQHFLLVSPDELLFVLKPFYGFYYEKSFTLPLSAETVNGTEILNIRWPQEKTDRAVPVARIGDLLFLDFYQYGSAHVGDGSASIDENETAASEEIAAVQGPFPESLAGYWRCAGDALHIGIDGPRYKKEVFCYYFTDTEVYTIRYWPADVVYEEQKARVSDGDFSFTVDKFLRLGNGVYTCVSGRGANVRNVKKQKYTATGAEINFSSGLESLSYVLSDDGRILGFLPAYVRQSSITDMDAEIALHNSRNKPPRKPPFDNYLDLDFRWEEIRRLRTDPFTGEVLGEFSFPPLEPLRTNP